MKTKSEEQILFPEVKIDDIIICPWSFGLLFELSEDLDILLNIVESKKISNYIFNNKGQLSHITIIKIFTLANDEVLRIISKTINKSHEEILQYDMVKGIKIVLAIFDQNSDIIKSRVYKDETKKKSKSGIPLSEVFTVLLQNNIGKDLNDLKYNFSIDQINLLFEKVCKTEMDKNRMQSIILANALTYTSTSYSRKDIHNKNSQWQKFIKSLDWDRIKEKTEKPKFKKVVGIFGSLGIPIVRKEDK